MDSESFKKLIDNINKGQYNQKELINLYKNAQSVNSIVDSQKESIIEAIEKSTRLKFPAAAKKMFGAKDSEARDILEKLYSRISGSCNLEKNKLKNGVKTGGGMIAGDCYIQIYLSYKNEKIMAH